MPPAPSSKRSLLLSNTPNGKRWVPAAAAPPWLRSPPLLTTRPRTNYSKLILLQGTASGPSLFVLEHFHKCSSGRIKRFQAQASSLVACPAAASSTGDFNCPVWNGGSPRSARRPAY